MLVQEGDGLHQGNSSKKWRLYRRIQFVRANPYRHSGRRDSVELGNNGLILIDGVPFPNSKPLSHDRAGQLLRGFNLPITLASDEIWLLSLSPFGFDSRYLGTANIFKCYKAVPLLTF